MEKWINIGHLFYYGETDQYGHLFYYGKTDQYGHIFYQGETDQYWTRILLWSNGFHALFVTFLTLS